MDALKSRDEAESFDDHVLAARHALNQRVPFGRSATSICSSARPSTKTCATQSEYADG